MERQKYLLDRLVQWADLPPEAVPGMPLVEILGEGRVLIENHRGVTEYGTDRISIRVGFGQIIICGCGLELSRMNREQLVILGRIDGVTLCRG